MTEGRHSQVSCPTEGDAMIRPQAQNPMSDRKSWGSSVIGWFVVQDQAPDPVVEGDAGGQPSTEPPLEVFSTAPPSAPGGKVDFEKIYECAGLSAEERERVSRTRELLTSLPAGTDDAVKKQIVMASLKAFGVPVEKIIETGAQELQALEAYIRAGAADTKKVTEEAEMRIKQQEEEIAKLRTVMEQRVEEQQAVIKACNDKKIEVQKVLEFFGQEAVAKVVRDSPKLQQPASK